MTGTDKKKNKLIIISGPSGVGKSTICAELVKRTDAFLSVSVTTRSKAQSEIDGRDYQFISEEEFETRAQKGDFLESAEVFGNSYATPRLPVEQALDKGKIVILEIDVQGAMAAKKIHPDATMVFVLPPSQSDLVGRMTGRGRGEDTKTAKKRLDSASQETAVAWQYYDHMVINEDIEQAINEIKQIIEGNVGKKK